MDPGRSVRNLLLSLLPLWVGCAQVPSKAPPVEQGGWGVPAVAVQGPTTDESAAPGSRSLVDEKIAHAGVNQPVPADGNGSSDRTSPGTDLTASPPTHGGQGLTLEEAKSLAFRLNPLLGQSLAAVETAKGNEEIAYS